MSTIRLKMWVAYEGSAFRGWQSQATGDAVQDHLEAAFLKLCGEPRTVVHGAGRTDAGVHGLGQVAHADVPAGKYDLFTWLSAINAHLPRGARVLKIVRAKPSFHARFDARGKLYIYRIWNDGVLHPLERGRAWHCPYPIDVRVLKQSAALLEGRHDFGGFAANRGKPEEDTRRTIFRIGVRAQGPLITLQVRGDGFLYRMVRLMTGSLVRVAQGKADPAWIPELLAGEGRLKSSFAAPAEGLYLTKVFYSPGPLRTTGLSTIA